MDKSEILGYHVTRYGMIAIDDYEEYHQVMSVEDFNKLEEKGQLLEVGLAIPLYANPNSNEVVDTKAREAIKDLIDCFLNSDTGGSDINIYNHEDHSHSMFDPSDKKVLSEIYTQLESKGGL